MHGKTGWGTSNIEIPVGWIEKDGKDLPKREEVTKESLKALNII